MMNNVNLEFYVLNYSFNERKVERFNIFRNYYVYEYAIKYTEGYLDGKISYNELKEELRKTIAWQEWGRCQYEISVGDAFEEDVNKLEKWDCYMQAEPNMEVITDMCIKRVRGLPWWSSDQDSMLSVQGAQVPSPVRELDPTCRN